MSNNLHELILAKCRDQVAESKSFPSWKGMYDFTVEHSIKTVSAQLIETCSQQAALLAMEELAGFMVWLSKECVPLTLSYCMEPKNQMYLETMYREYEEYGRGKQ